MLTENNITTLQTFDLYISQVDSLLTKTYKEGNHQKEELYNTVINFLFKSFPNGKERCIKFIQSCPVSTYFHFKESEEDNQKYYISYLKAIRDSLVANKEELRIKIEEIPMEKIEETVKIPMEKIEDEPVRIKKNEKQEETTITKVIAEENLVANKEELPSEITKENIVDDPFSMLAGSLKWLSESTKKKSKDMDKINQEILDMKEDIQNIKSILNNISKVFTSHDMDH